MLCAAGADGEFELLTGSGAVRFSQPLHFSHGGSDRCWSGGLTCGPYCGDHSTYIQVCVFVWGQGWMIYM